MTKLYVEQKNENARLKFTNSVDKASEKYWFEEFEKQVLQNKKCRDHNIEQKAEIMKLEKQVGQLTAQYNWCMDQNVEYAKNERQYLDTVISQNELIDKQINVTNGWIDAYENMKRKRDGLASLLIASVICGLIFYIW